MILSSRHYKSRLKDRLIIFAILHLSYQTGLSSNDDGFLENYAGNMMDPSIFYEHVNYAFKVDMDGIHCMSVLNSYYQNQQRRLYCKHCAAE